MPRPLNLTAILAVAAVVELCASRLAARLFLPQVPTALVSRAVTALGHFAHNLGGVLGLALLLGTIFSAGRRRELFPRSMRLTVATIALFFAALTGLGIFVPLPERLLVHLKTSHAFLAWFLAMAHFRTAAPLRGKLGLTLFAVPTVLHAAALFADRLGWQRPFPGELARAAEMAALGAAALSPVLLPPAFPRGALRIFGIAAGVLVGGLVAFALGSAFDLSQMVALYGFRLDLPPLAGATGWGYALLLVAAAAGATATAALTIPARGPARLVGLGVVLLAAAGSQALAPHHVVYAMCGLLAIALGNARAAAAPDPARRLAPEPA